MDTELRRGIVASVSVCAARQLSQHTIVAPCTVRWCMCVSAEPAPSGIYFEGVLSHPQSIVAMASAMGRNTKRHAGGSNQKQKHRSGGQRTKQWKSGTVSGWTKKNVDRDFGRMVKNLNHYLVEKNGAKHITTKWLLDQLYSRGKCVYAAKGKSSLTRLPIYITPEDPESIRSNTR